MENPADIKFMQEALHLASLARLISPPNPWVGAVLVKDGIIIGRGYTQKPGGMHAEVQAISEAKDSAQNIQGSTLYVTLEPCSHFGRTPPCTEKILDLGIARVVIALLDPDEKVRGTGIQRLWEAGIEVCYGVCSKEAEALLEPYLFHRTFGRSFVVAKAAISIDGKIAAQDGTSQWISTKEARQDAHKLRALSQAILVGSQTVLEDTPQLTVRDVQLPASPPLRVVLDGRGRTDPIPGNAPTLLMTCQHNAKTLQWEKAGAEVVIAPLAKDQRGIDLPFVLTYLAKKGVLQVLVEGGGTLLESLLSEQLINQLVLYVGPCLLAGGRSLFPSLTIPTISQAKRLHLKNCQMLGQTVRLDYSM